MSKRSSEIQYLVNNSRLRIWRKGPESKLDTLRLEFMGMAAKIPSVTNNQMVMIPTQRFLVDFIDKVMADPKYLTRTTLSLIRNKVREMRAQRIKNPLHVNMLAAMNHLYESALGETKLTFADTKDDRLFCLILLSPVLNRHDTHNIPKATCDWLQAMGIVNNDSHMDVLALRKTDYKVRGDSTDVLIFRGHLGVHLLRMITTAQTLTGNVTEAVADLGLCFATPEERTA